MKRSLLLLGLCMWAAPAAAQGRDVVFDSSTTGTPATIECGFCTGEKFGTVFRQLSSPSRPGLRTSEFPLTLNSVMLAIARTNESGGSCTGTSAGGTVSMMIEAYAGVTPPSGSIVSNPATGSWPGETMLFAQSADLQLSVEMPAGSMMYNIMVNTVMIDMGVNVPAPNTYIRVVVTIPDGSGTTTSDSCTLLSLTPPSAVGLIDGDGPIEPNVDFIYAINPAGDFGLGYQQGWHWNEESNPAAGVMPINGDWVMRLHVTPAGTSTPDAGTGTPDAGSGTPDAGSGTPDAGTTQTMDAGSTARDDAGSTSAMCSADRDCAGGERCTNGACQRVSCAAASDCAGGMTCVDGMCRNLCSSNADCNGGEVCDMTAGNCVPVSTTSSGGCGCRATGRSDGSPLVLLGLAALAALMMRRRR